MTTNEKELSKSEIEVHIDLSVDNGCLGGSHMYDDFFTYKGYLYRVCIQQSLIRRISIACEKRVTCSEILGIFQKIEWLLMMFDGRFMTITKMEIFDSEGLPEKYENDVDSYLKRRLKLYDSADYCKNNMKAIDYYNVDIVGILPQWVKLLEELKLVHPMLLYNVADTGLPVDCKCANIIQIFEPLTELIKLYRSSYCVVPKQCVNNRKDSWLRRCLETAINQYGSSIFEMEMHNCNGVYVLTDHLKNCRNRIMHIASKQTKEYMSATQNILYSAKLFILYRVIVFDLLGISNESYDLAIGKIAKHWDEWYSSIS